jgi:acetolactate synthase-1/2/3 large subunit
MPTNADILAESIKAHGVPHVHVYPGGSVAPLLDALQRIGVELCVGRSESGAGFAAIGEARVTRRPAVCLFTCGPGHTNAVTTIADAYCDSIPLLVLIGRPVLEPSRAKVRQRAFQDVTFDLSGICKAEVQIPDRAVGRWLWDCYDLASSGRPGPVVMHLPMDVQQQEAEELGIVLESGHWHHGSDFMGLNDAMNALGRAARPLVLAGAGIYQAGAVSRFRAFVHNSGLPVVTSMPGLGVIATDDPLNCGMIGHVGFPVANQFLAECDALLVLGARLDVRQTGTEVAAWRAGKTIISIEADPAEVAGGRVKPDILIGGDLLGTLDEMRRRTVAVPHGALTVEAEPGGLTPSPVYDGLTARAVVRAVDHATAGRELLVVTGSGAHQVHVARNMTLDHPKRRWISSCGLGTMGTGLPYAIGACQAAPGVPAVCFVGDAEIQHTVAELITIAQRRLPIKVIVLDNRRLGLVSQFQLGKYGSDPTCHGEQEEGIEWAEIARSTGLKAGVYRDLDDQGWRSLLGQDGPAFLHFLTSYEEECWPMMMAGDKVGEMSWPKEGAP